MKLPVLVIEFESPITAPPPLGTLLSFPIITFPSPLEPIVLLRPNMTCPVGIPEGRPATVVLLLYPPIIEAERLVVLSLPKTKEDPCPVESVIVLF